MVPPLRVILDAIIARVWFPALLLPPLLTVLVAVLVVRDPTVFDYAWAERLGIAIPALTVIVAALCAARSRAPFFVWLTALTANFLTREIHFAGTSASVYVGLGILLLLAWRGWERLATFLTYPPTITLLGCAFVTYGITITVDAGWWEFLPYERTFGTPVEESMELVGHCFLLAAALLPSPPAAEV